MYSYTSFQRLAPNEITNCRMLDAGCNQKPNEPSPVWWFSKSPLGLNSNDKQKGKKQVWYSKTLSIFRSCNDASWNNPPLSIKNNKRKRKRHFVQIKLYIHTKQITARTSLLHITHFRLSNNINLSSFLKIRNAR
jgi:hypothetical protein